MSELSVQEIGSLLNSRLANHAEEPPHKNWGFTTRAALVILWGLLVYPVLDPDLRRKGGTGYIHVNRLYSLFHEYLGEKAECKKLLETLRHYDYIRFRRNGMIVAGTELLSAVDAAKMYRVFRSSLLYRKMEQENGG